MIDAHWYRHRTHHGVVLDVSHDKFDRVAATFSSVFVNDDDPKNHFLFYTGAQDVQWSHTAIGLAESKDGINFRRTSKDPVLEGDVKSFCHMQALTPTVTRIGNRFYMIFAGKPHAKSFRRLGIAYADDPKGPWRIIGELIKRSSLWEGRDIDNGPSVMRLNDDTVLVFYSNVTSWKSYDILAILRRYPIRKIGILKVRIAGTSMSSIEVHRYNGNPLKHLNGPKGDWNESLFCPGYVKLNNTHYLFPAASIYSLGFPQKQYVGVARSNSSFFAKSTSKIEKLLDGPSEKSQMLSGIKGEIALDSPAPLVKIERQMLFLYYSVMDRTDEIWKTALTTFNLGSKID